MARETTKYGIDALAELGGVTRRTVRYYVQEGLIPAPYGLGRGDHYGPEHLQALMYVKAMQEAGRTLDEIRQPPSRRSDRAATEMPAAADTPALAEWRRIELVSGVELHVSGRRRLPSAAALRTLAEWCRVHLTREGEDDDAR